MSDDHGLFKPYTRRMAAARKKQLIDKFLEDKTYFSGSGLTGRIIIQHCLENNIQFTVTWFKSHGGIMSGYVIKPYPRNQT